MESMNGMNNANQNCIRIHVYQKPRRKIINFNAPNNRLIQQKTYYESKIGLTKGKHHTGKL